MEGSLVAYKVFSNGSVLNASEINDNLMNQSVMVFSNSAARSAAITSPVEGMTTYLEDTNFIDTYSGTSWVPTVSNSQWDSYTPILSASTGSFTSATIAGSYKLIGKVCHLRLFISITTNGTAAGRIRATLPFAQRPEIYVGVWRENNINGALGQTFVQNDLAQLVTSANLYPGANGHALAASVSYEVL
jgi:hypothetical protein